MTAADWVSRSVAILRPGTRKKVPASPADTAQAAIKNIATGTPAASRSTRERLGATLRQKEEALSPRVLRRTLEELRAAILAAPIDPEVLDVIYRRVRLKLGGKGVFVRSSTNAEDLPGFNGAGLYDTVPNVRGKEALGVALKTVWASLWNLRAVEERTTFGIDHRQVFAAVLVQVGVAATAAGVKRGLGFQVPFAARAKAEAGIKTMAVGLILEAGQAEAIMREHARLAHRNLERALANPGVLTLVPGSSLIRRRFGTG